MKKIFLFSFLIIAISFSANIFAHPKETTLPLKFGSGFQKPNVSLATDVIIANQKIPLIFDTGFGGADLMLSKKIVEKLKVKYIKTKEKVCGISVAGKYCAPIIILPKIKLGGFILHNIKVETFSKQWVHDKSWNYQNFKEGALKNGEIGLSLLKRFNFLVDFKRRQVTLYKPQNHPDINFQSWAKASFQTKYGFIGTRSTINNIPVHLVWDTANIPSQIKPFKKLAHDIHTCPKSYDLMTENLKCFTSTTFISSKRKLPNNLFIFRSLNLPKFAPIDGFIGTNFFFSNKVFFDFNSHFLYIKPYS